MASWKVASEAKKTVEYVAFAQAQKYFAVDASGSTGGAPLSAERVFAETINKAGKNSAITRWGTKCDNPTNEWSKIRWRSDRGGTYPSEILSNPASLDAIRTSDIWFLLTDGEVLEDEVHDLARLGQEKGIFSCPTVFLITSVLSASPSTVNVSVGMTSFANCTDALCLFKDYRTGYVYVIATKGCFGELEPKKETESPGWADLTSFESESKLIERLAQLQVKVPTFQTRETASKGLNLGSVVVGLDKLLGAGKVSEDDLKTLLADDALDTLALACKSWGKLAHLRNFLAIQKVETVNIQLEDVSGAADLISQLGKDGLTDQAKSELQLKLRAAHTANRERYLKAKENDSAGVAARNINRLVDGALRTVADLEKAGYTADILSRRSNRARRANVVSGDQVESAALDFDAPAFRGVCEVCCGEDEVLSVCLKVLAPEDAASNTADFTLQFPLEAGRFTANVNVISSQCICFSCAVFGRPGLSIYAEPIAAVIPTLQYTGSNRQYINQQLYIALNGGLKTGVPVLGQLFATILDRTLQTKVWAGAKDTTAKETVVDNEVKQRQNCMSWLMHNILERLECRETFNELGAYTVYPNALAWVVKDFRTEGLTSWAMNYPVAGFNQLLRFGKLLVVDTFTDQVVQEMKATKLIHSFVSAYLAKLLQNGGDRLWTKDFLALLYAEFNADLVPRYIGRGATIMKSADSFWEMLTKLLDSDPDLLADWSPKDQENFMPRIQVLGFWLIYFQTSHTSAKTYFLKLKETEELSVSVLDPKAQLPSNVVDEILLSLFLNKAAFINKLVAESHVDKVIPFENPFGASVLHCGSGYCSVSFAPPEIATLEGDKWTPLFLDRVRLNRAKHLVDVYGMANRFEGNRTGLPEPVSMPKSPSSSHVTLHISTVRVWSRLSVEERRAVAKSVAEEKLESDAVAKFIRAVRMEVCSHGRGDIFRSEIGAGVSGLLPSFMNALGEALVLEGSDGKDVALYEHDFTKNNMEWKAKHEIAIRGLKTS